MGAVLNRVTSRDGVIAYQDHQEATTFHYLPARIDAVYGETLRDFKVTYYGINKQPYYADFGAGLSESVVGGVLAGRAVPDITDSQRDAITEAINDAFRIPQPNLVPLEITDIQTQPVFAKTIAEMGQGSNAEFPQILKFGSSFNYIIDSSNSLFAEMAGAAINGSVAEENPDVGINITGNAEFYGDPWIARIECDLSQVWEYTRTQVDVGISLGWLNFGLQIDDITQSLIREGIVNIEYIEGSGGNEFGRQLLETSKTLFESINAQAVSGEGFFRFEPNPEPQQLPEKEDPLGAGLLPWTASINVGYAAQSFTQEIKYKNEISFTGKVQVPITTSMNLALPCNTDTEEFFYDLQEKEIGCITKSKSDNLQERLGAEAKAKNDILQDLFQDVRDGKITTKEYVEMKALLNTLTFTESDTLSLDEARARFHRIREALHRPSQAA